MPKIRHLRDPMYRVAPSCTTPIAPQGSADLEEERTQYEATSMLGGSGSPLIPPLNRHSLVAQEQAKVGER